MYVCLSVCLSEMFWKTKSNGSLKANSNDTRNNIDFSGVKIIYNNLVKLMLSIFGRLAGSVYKLLSMC